jgi:hypothetical protein
MSRRVAALLVIGIVLAGVPGRADPPHDVNLPARATEKVEAMPDLCQTDRAFRTLPDRGRNWCGPTAFANVILAMDQRGFDALVPGDRNAKDQQLRLLEELGSEKYLCTKGSGTGPVHAMRGLAEFVHDRGYKATVAWEGWRNGGEFSKAATIDQQWLQEGLLGDSAVVINVGWYKLDRVNRLYTRIGGHYMTLAGYRQNGDGFVYLIHDPASRSGPGKVTHEARLVPIPSGRLAPWKQYGGRPAAGHFRIEGIVIKSTADLAILDGAIRLTIAKQP